MKLKRFEDFVSEKYKIDWNMKDVQYLLQLKNYNDTEDFIKTWAENKQKILNFYLSKSRNEEQERDDLIDFYFKKGYIEKKTKDLKQLKFRVQYKLLNDWSELCKLKKELIDNKSIIKGNQTDISNAEENYLQSGTDTVAKDSQEKIEQSQDRLKKNDKNIKEIEFKIRDIDARVKKEFDLLIKKFKASKLIIDKKEKERKTVNLEDKTKEQKPGEEETGKP